MAPLTQQHLKGPRSCKLPSIKITKGNCIVH